MGEYSIPEDEIDATGMRFAIVAARFNRDITEQLARGAEKVLLDHGAADVSLAWVPGAFELPLVAKKFAQVVIAHAAADDEHALIAKRRQCAAQREMQGGVESRLQRHLQNGHVGIRIDEKERHEYPVVQAAPPPPQESTGVPALMHPQTGRSGQRVYARNRDYHDIIKGRLKEIATRFAARAGEDVKVFVDTSPVMEKPLAAAAGPRSYLMAEKAEARITPMGTDRIPTHTRETCGRSKVKGATPSPGGKNEAWTPNDSKKK